MCGATIGQQYSRRPDHLAHASVPDARVLFRCPGYSTVRLATGVYPSVTFWPPQLPKQMTR